VYALTTRAVDAAGNVSTWRTDTVRVDVTAPSNDTPAAPAGWRAVPYTVEVIGSDGDGSGVAQIERTIDGGDVSVDPDVTVGDDGEHVLATRIVDAVGHASEWRTETIKIDSVSPAVALDCGSDGWRAAPVTCTVAADGGPSGVTVTVARNGGAPETVAGGTVVVEADGEHALAARAADGAGNTADAAARVRVDRGAPHVEVACEGSACRVTASDAVSGVAAVAYRVDAGAWQAPAGDGAFTVAAGRVQARAVDAAGNESVTADVTVEAAAKPGRARSATRPVYLRGRSGSSAMIGALRASRSASGTVAVDLRPLALGRGKFRITLQIRAGKARRTVTRTVTIGRGGTSPRVRTKLEDATRKATVTLRVDRKAGSGWRSHASGRVVLGP
jgi:hypothetical protein